MSTTLQDQTVVSNEYSGRWTELHRSRSVRMCSSICPTRRQGQADRGPRDRQTMSYWIPLASCCPFSAFCTHRRHTHDETPFSSMLQAGATLTRQSVSDSARPLVSTRSYRATPAAPTLVLLPEDIHKVANQRRLAGPSGTDDGRVQVRLHRRIALHGGQSRHQSAPAARTVCRRRAANLPHSPVRLIAQRRTVPSGQRRSARAQSVAPAPRGRMAGIGFASEAELLRIQVDELERSLWHLEKSNQVREASARVARGAP